MSKEKIQCVVCRAQCSAELIHENVLGDEAKRHRVMVCVNCGHEQLDPPGYDLDFYEEDNQVKNVIKYYGTPFENLVRHSWVEAERRVDRFYKHDIFNDESEHAPNFRVLDVGGGYGTFASKLLERIPTADVTVIEPSKSRVETGKEILKQAGTQYIPTFDTREINQQYVDEYQGAFDMVCLWHVLEHLEDPSGFLLLLSKLVKPGGVICVEVPNRDDDLLKRSKGFKNRWYMVEHVSFFSSEALKTCARKKADFESIDIYGYQRYGIFNYIHWIEKNSAQGAEPDLLESDGRWWLEETWIKARESMLTSDALFMVCTVR